MTDYLLRAWPGLLFSVIVALAASYLAEHYNGPAMLFALLLGMSFNQFADSEAMSLGVTLASKEILRIGVALLGARITFGAIASLGKESVLVVLAGVFLTIVVGYWIAKAMRSGKGFALISASAVAICGASAALAVASVLPRTRENERSTMLSVVAVTTLSTVAMLLYPLFVSAVGFDDRLSGIFLGATIHDVAQVVGAGYTISVETGDTAAIVKLLRVACLVPTIMAISILCASEREAGRTRWRFVPWFLVAFVALVLLGSAGFIPERFQLGLSNVSRWCLLTAIAALGIRTSLRELIAVGPSPLITVVLQTTFLAAFVYVAIAT